MNLERSNQCMFRTVDLLSVNKIHVCCKICISRPHKENWEKWSLRAGDLYIQVTNMLFISVYLYLT